MHLQRAPPECQWEEKKKLSPAPLRRKSSTSTRAAGQLATQLCPKTESAKSRGEPQSTVPAETRPRSRPVAASRSRSPRRSQAILLHQEGPAGETSLPLRQRHPSQALS